MCIRDRQKANNRIQTTLTEVIERLMSVRNAIKTGGEVRDSNLKEIRAVSAVLGGLAERYPSPRTRKSFSPEEFLDYTRGQLAKAMTEGDEAGPRLAALKEALSGAENVLYIADNAGEIALDTLLVEEIGPGRVTLVVKGGPIINDATMEDARAIGLADLCRVITTGCDWPGAPLSRVGEEFAGALAAADVVISKGQANFETLSDWDGPIFFLFLAKCPCVADELGVQLGEAVVAASPRAARRT